MNGKALFTFGSFLFAGWISAAPAKPEPFEDILRDAVKEYRAGRVDKTREALDRAIKLLDERKSGKVVDAFPEAPEGWTVGDVEKSEIPAIMGGGRSIKKIYREKEGKKEISLEVIHDSPFGKLLMGLMVNDAVAEAQGFKVRSVGADRALFKETADGGELNLPIDEKILVKLTSKGGALEKDMMALARYIDRLSLKKVE
jgi:hypothetical protein